MALASVAACPDGPSLYFSQFQEASSGNKKYFQIYNPTAAAISLGAEYSLAYCANGCDADGVFEYNAKLSMPVPVEMMPPSSKAVPDETKEDNV